MKQGFKLLTFIILGIFLLSFTSAITWDNEAYYRLDETSGTNAVDATGVNNGTINGATVGIVGKIDKAYAFDGANDNVVIPKTIQGKSAFTINSWVKTNDTSNDRIIIAQDSVFRLGQDSSSGGWSGFVDTGGRVSIVGTSSMVVDTWTMVTMAYNSTHILLYVNGVLENITAQTGTVDTEATWDQKLGEWSSASSTLNWNGSIDEVGIWNRSLTASEVNDLWSGGAGITYGGVPNTNTATITLIEPTDELTLSTTGTNFTANYNLSLGTYNWTNATYYLWYSNGTLFNNSVTINLNGTDNTTTEFIDAFTLGNYLWNVEAWYGNSTYQNYTTAPNNFSFFVGASINSETFENFTFETKAEKFSADVSLLNGTTLYLAELIYNGTTYEGSSTEYSSGNFYLNTTIDIPTIPSEPTNYSWYWRLTYQSDGAFIFQNLTTHSQQVNKIHLGACGGTLAEEALNFSAYDEETRNRVSKFDFKATFFYWLGSGSQIKNFSFDNSSVESVAVCIYPANFTYYLVDSDIEYSGNESEYTTRNYYFENYTITNQTEQVNLYLLNLSSSTSFILNVRNQNQQAVQDALIYTERYYPEIGEYKVVQIAKSDENGKSIGFFKIEIVDYRFRIIQDGVTELLTQKQKVVPEETPYTLTFTIGGSLDKPWMDFDDLSSLTSSITFSKSTNITTYTYIDSSDDFDSARFLVRKINYNGSATTICDTTSTQSSNSLTCDLSAYSGTFEAIGYITRDGITYVVEFQVFQHPTSDEIFGNTGVILAWFLILTASLAFVWHPIAGIVGAESMILFTNLTGLVAFSPAFVWGSLAVSIILIFLLKD